MARSPLPEAKSCPRNAAGTPHLRSWANADLRALRSPIFDFSPAENAPARLPAELQMFEPAETLNRSPEKVCAIESRSWVNEDRTFDKALSAPDRRDWSRSRTAFWMRVAMSFAAPIAFPRPATMPFARPTTVQ